MARCCVRCGKSEEAGAKRLYAEAFCTDRIDDGTKMFHFAMKWLVATTPRALTDERGDAPICQACRRELIKQKMDDPNF